MASSSPLYFPEDEDYARDLELAWKLHDKEVSKSRRRKGKQQEHQSEFSDGFSRGCMNADHMLFVECTMDGAEVAMLVDTGASTSAMSIEMVNVLGLRHKMNESIYGNATGVGSSPILGIVEHVNCMIGEDVGFRSFFMVLEGSMPYCILGLDQMRRFNCIVDVGGGCMVFGGRDGVSVPFLPQEFAANVANSMMHDYNCDNGATNNNGSATSTQHFAQGIDQEEEQSGVGSWKSKLPWGKK